MRKAINIPYIYISLCSYKCAYISPSVYGNIYEQENVMIVKKEVFLSIKDLLSSKLCWQMTDPWHEVYFFEQKMRSYWT